MGRAGRCRQISLCVGSTHHVPATLGLPRTGVSVLSPCTLLRLPAALYGVGPALRAVPVFGSSTKARTRLCLRFVTSPPEQLRQPGAWRANSPGCGGPLPSAAPASVSARASWVRAPCVQPRPSRRMLTIQNLRKSLVRNWRPVYSVGGDAFSGAVCPFPLPPSSCLQRGWAGLQPASSSGLAQTLCSANGQQCVQAG